jgi:O-antigen ligase
MWRWAVDLFLDNPVLGVGTGGYYKAILTGGGDQGIAHPHNNVLYVAVSWGIIGILVFTWFFWVLLKAGWQHRNHSIGFFILSSCLVILIGGMANSHLLDAGGALLLAVTTGLVSALPGEKTGAVGTGPGA